MTNTKGDWANPSRGMWAYGSTNVVDFRDYQAAVDEIERLQAIGEARKDQRQSLQEDQERLETEIERLQAECARLLARGDKAELQLNALKTHYARRAAAEPLQAPQPLHLPGDVTGDWLQRLYMELVDVVDTIRAGRSPVSILEGKEFAVLREVASQLYERSLKSGGGFVEITKSARERIWECSCGEWMRDEDTHCHECKAPRRYPCTCGRQATGDHEPGCKYRPDFILRT